MLSELESKPTSTSVLPPELLLEVFDEPIMFHRCYVALTGSVTAALVLSYASYATEELVDLDAGEHDGWFVKPVPTGNATPGSRVRNWKPRAES